jgi:hypothetical protein
VEVVAAGALLPAGFLLLLPEHAASRAALSPVAPAVVSATRRLIRPVGFDDQ